MFMRAPERIERFIEQSQRAIAAREEHRQERPERTLMRLGVDYSEGLSLDRLLAF